MSHADNATEQLALQACTTHALEARATLKRAAAMLDEWSYPRSLREHELHQAIEIAVKKAALDVLQILCLSSLAVDSHVPQVPMRN